MAHFAQLDASSIVLRVIVIDNDNILDPDGNESEPVGIAFCRSLYGADTLWRQTSYNATFRKNYAGIGYRYDTSLDAFIVPQPYPSWTLNTDTCQWTPPKPYPTDGRAYSWDESLLRWVQG
jgi:hypothetical protein